MGLLGGDKLIIGYDLGYEYAQISFSASADGDVETLSQVAGGKKYNIPAALCKRYGANQWTWGREAIRMSEEEQGVLVENLLSLALDGEPVIIDGESFDPVALLALFFKRSLGNIKTAAMMLTCPVLDQRAVEVLGQVVGSVRMKTEKIFFQGYGESFYSYMLRQPEELWLHQSVLFDYRQEYIRVYRMGCNRRTRPIVVFIEEAQYAMPEDPAGEQEKPEDLDQSFCRIAEEVCGEMPVGSVFLIGDRFSEDWMKDSLRFLCRGRRVFQGNNLFSKGACCGMQERLEGSQAGKSHVYLGRDKLKANVGMGILRQGEESYYALLDAGINWYEARQETDIYLQEGNEFFLTITPLILKSFPERGSDGSPGKSSSNVRIVLDGLSGTAARIRLILFMESEGRLIVEVEDLGFGQFRPSSGRTWRETIDIYAD